MTHARRRAGTRTANYLGGTRSQFGDGTSLTGLAKACGPMVYAFRTRDGLIKIGYTEHLDQRAVQLGGGLRSLLALKPGTYDDEQAIHRTLRASRHHGREYYYPTPAVLDVVNTMRTAMGLSAIAA